MLAFKKNLKVMSCEKQLNHYILSSKITSSQKTLLISILIKRHAKIISNNKGIN